MTGDVRLGGASAMVGEVLLSMMIGSWPGLDTSLLGMLTLDGECQPPGTSNSSIPHDVAACAPSPEKLTTKALLAAKPITDEYGTEVATEALPTPFCKAIEPPIHVTVPVGATPLELAKWSVRDVVTMPVVVEQLLGVET